MGSSAALLKKTPDPVEHLLESVRVLYEVLVKNAVSPSGSASSVYDGHVHAGRTALVEMLAIQNVLRSSKKAASITATPEFEGGDHVSKVWQGDTIKVESSPESQAISTIGDLLLGVQRGHPVYWKALAPQGIPALLQEEGVVVSVQSA